MSIQAGQPTAVDCGSFTNIPEDNLDWEIQLGGSQLVPINLNHDRATVGLDQMLYLLEPRADDSGTIFRCNLRNAELSTLSVGYVQITVQGKSL